MNNILSKNIKRIYKLFFRAFPTGRAIHYIFFPSAAPLWTSRMYSNYQHQLPLVINKKVKKDAVAIAYAALKKPCD